jgi:alkylation response protein AidB-like acyl-CoA dehydrogenase
MADQTVDLTFSEDQLALRETLVDFLARECPTERVRSAEPLGFDLALWRQMEALGLPTIAVPEEMGGGGGTVLDLAIAAEEVGRCLAPVPFLDAAVANNLVAELALGDAEGPSLRLAEQTVAGSRLAAPALRSSAHGTARLVPAGAVADVVLVLDGDDLVAVEGGVSPGSPAAPTPNLGSLPMADRRVDGEGRTVLCSGKSAVEAHRRAVDQWQLLMAAALVGLGARALEIGVDYVQQRRAFGVVIANFQTIQHRLADTATAVDGARLLAYEAAWAADQGLSSAPALARMTLVFAAETAFKSASDSLHFHGGYGYTLEYDIQLFFRRAKAWPLIFGDPARLYRDVADALLTAEVA